MSDFLKVADLNEEDVTRLRALEQELGVHIMAFEPGLNVADLSSEQLARIRMLEKELGVTLIAYQD